MNQLVESEFTQSESTITVKAGPKIGRFAGLILQETEKSALGSRFLFTSAPYADIGLSGHALCGGYGTFGRSIGYLGDQIVSMTIVDSRGELQYLDAETNGELFRTILGSCTSAFGVVVTFTFRLWRLDGPYLTRTAFAAPSFVQGYHNQWGANRKVCSLL